MNNIRVIRDRIVAEGYEVLEYETGAAYTFVKIKYQDIEGCGFAKCHPNDNYNPELGHKIALGRALMDCAEQISAQEYGGWAGIIMAVQGSVRTILDWAESANIGSDGHTERDWKGSTPTCA